jgi:preprotein translocase subunit SecG
LSLADISQSEQGGFKKYGLAIRGINRYISRNRADRRRRHLNLSTGFFPMQTVLIVVQLLVVVAMIAVILLQQSEGGGLGMGGGQGGGLVSVRGTANLLTRTTAILAAIFFLTSIALAVLSTRGTHQTSILDTTPTAPSAPADQSTPETPAKPQPAQPGVPLSE